MDLSLGDIRFEIFARYVSLMQIRVGSFACELSLGNVRSPLCVWDLSFENFRLGSIALELSLDLFA